jgi:hypothetical protein
MAQSLKAFLLPGCAVRKAEAFQGLWLDLNAISGLARHLIVPAMELYRSHKVLVQMVDKLNDAIFKRARNA